MASWKTSLLMTSHMRGRLRMDTYLVIWRLLVALTENFGVVVGWDESPIGGEKLEDRG